MFCPIERLELKTSACPANRCMYKDTIGQCQHDLLTSDQVSAQEIAEVRQLKPYKVKADSVQSKDMIMKGLIALRYSDFVKDSFPTNAGVQKAEVAQTVNEVEDAQVRKALFAVFGLSEYQQDKFLDEARFEAWATRSRVEVEFDELKTALMAVSHNL